MPRSLGGGIADFMMIKVSHLVLTFKRLGMAELR